MKKAQIIKFRRISQLANELMSDELLDRSKIRILESEINSMLKTFIPSKKFFKRLS